MHAFFRQYLLNWKLFMREGSAVFWTFAFPLLMLGAFGLIFRPGGPSRPSLVVVGGEGEARLTRFLAQAPVKAVRLDPGTAETRWRKGETSVQLHWTAAGPELRVNAYLASQGMPTAQRAQLAWMEVQAAEQGVPLTSLPLRVESPGRASAAHYTAFLLPGILGMNLLSMGLFAVGMVQVFHREKGILRRLAVTPLPRSLFMGAQVAQRASVFLLQTVLLLAVGYFAFGIACAGSHLALALVLALGAACFMAMGFAMAGFARTHEGYAALSNAFFFPMMIFSGVYFTLDAAPRWMQQASHLLPLSPFLKALRAIFNDGASLSSQGWDLALVGLWTLLCIGTALKKFRWT